MCVFSVMNSYLGSIVWFLLLFFFHYSFFLYYFLQNSSISIHNHLIKNIIECILFIMIEKKTSSLLLCFILTFANYFLFLIFAAREMMPWWSNVCTYHNHPPRNVYANTQRENAIKIQIENDENKLLLVSIHQSRFYYKNFMPLYL